MKKLKKWFSFAIMTLVMILSGGGAYAMAAAGDLNGDTAVTDPVGPLDGPGGGVAGASTNTQNQELMEQQHDYDYYIKQIDKNIVEMRLESCPIDQILRASGKVNKSISQEVKYYQIGQRPITSTLTQAVEATTTGTTTVLHVANNSAFDMMDTIIFPDYHGYDKDGRETLNALMVRVVASDTNQNPIVIAINGKPNASKNNRWDMPAIENGAKLVRLGRAAAEKDVETGSYYNLPEPSTQYCQRFMMEVEESKIEQLMQKVVKWDFTRQERLAMDDMRNGMERSGLFSTKAITRYGKAGNIYTTGGIYWIPSKDIEIGHWEKKLDAAKQPIQVEVEGAQKYVYEYVITEKELTAFVAAVLKDAGNTSRTKMLFVDNLIYQAFSNLRSNRRIITSTEKDYRGWKIDFEAFESMGTKFLIYRHDAFNYMDMDGAAFLLDPRYLEKWVFGDWTRTEYDLKKLFIRNGDSVVMEEFSCWTLYYPNAHARVTRPAFTETDGVTDEIEEAA